MERRRAESLAVPRCQGCCGRDRPRFLNPSDADDRSLLIAFEHPELNRAQEKGIEEVVVDGETIRPGLHLNIHEVVANQIWDGNPEVTWRTAERLTGLGHDRHEVLHMVCQVVMDEISAALREKRLHTPELMAAALAALPESWEARRNRPNRHDRHHPRRRR